MPNETKQYMIYFKQDGDDTILNRRVYIAGSAKEAACAFEANMPSATWTDIYELVPALTNGFTR